MGSILNRIGYDGEWQRDLYLVQASRPELLQSLEISTGYCVCLLLWDAAGEDIGTMANVAEVLLRSGCVYLCAWGDNCALVHDVYDMVACRDHGEKQADGAVVMITWHDREPLEEALWFFLRCAWPDDCYADDCGAGREKFPLPAGRSWSTEALTTGRVRIDPAKHKKTGRKGGRCDACNAGRARLRCP